MIKCFFLWLLSLGLLAAICVSIFIFYLSSQLPSVTSLRDVQLQVPLRIFSKDGGLIAEFGEQRRVPVKIENIPPTLINAVLATEDHRFYEHAGVDFVGLSRAAYHVISEGTKSQGGSTITMQVARNFFLSRKKSYLRKINEILLAIKIESLLSKNEILELYLNQVFFGYRAYGVAAAAEVYYGKTLDELNLAEAAMIAGIPKAPSTINPLANPTAAKARRNHVLERMLSVGFITPSEYETAKQTSIETKYHGRAIEVSAPYVAEMVRQELAETLGNDVYTTGLQVYTTIDSHLQTLANQSLRQGIMAYDKRHGYRKPKKMLSTSAENWPKELSAIQTSGDLIPAAVTKVAHQSIDFILANGQTGTINWDGLSWAKPALSNGRFGHPPKTAAQVASQGQVIYITQQEDGAWQLDQMPEVEGAFVALNPNDGAVLALTGGFDFNRSKFNRVTQAELQPGSNFKPFVYTAALDKGFTTASIINDAPVVLPDTSQEKLWRPQNENRQFNGPTRFREGLVRSRNLVSIRVLQTIGIPYTIDYLKRFGFDTKKIPQGPSLALGTANLTPLAVAQGYSVFANGGFRVKPFFIDRIENVNGDVIFKEAPSIACDFCPPPQAPRVIEAQTIYIIDDMLKDVIQRGTGRGAKRLGRQDIAGKTGTTNNHMDAWFSGYNRDIVATVWVGFDSPQSLNEYAANVALPIWTNFMEIALKDLPERHLAEPPGIITVRIDAETGLLARPEQIQSIFEIFREDNMPMQYAPNQTYNPYANDITRDNRPEQLF